MLFALRRLAPMWLGVSLVVMSLLCSVVEAKEGKGGKHFSSKPIPQVPPASLSDKLYFGLGVACVLVVAGVRTWTKVRAGEPIPGYTQATYMKVE